MNLTQVPRAKETCLNILSFNFTKENKELLKVVQTLNRFYDKINDYEQKRLVGNCKSSVI